MIVADAMAVQAALELPKAELAPVWLHGRQLTLDEARALLLEPRQLAQEGRALMSRQTLAEIEQ